MTGEPGTFCLCHLTLERGTGSGIAVIEEGGITDQIMAVGADRPAVNTGHRGRAIICYSFTLDALCTGSFALYT